MRGSRDFSNALVVAMLSIGLTLGALSISLVGFIPEAAPEPTQVLIVSPVPVTATNTLPPTLTPSLAQSSPTWTPTNTVLPPTSCQPPAGWIPVSVLYGETLDSLAFKYNTTKDTLKSGNCLVSDTLLPGTILYVPYVAATNTVASCNKGAVGWSPSYKVIAKDTLFSIALRYYTTLDTLKTVNCLVSDRINVGDTLWVPNVATRTPSFTPPPGITYTVAPVLTEPLTQTALPFTLTPLPTQTPIPATSTPVPTATATAISTFTASPTAFPTATP